MWSSNSIQSKALNTSQPAQALPRAGIAPLKTREVCVLYRYWKFKELPLTQDKKARLRMGHARHMYYDESLQGRRRTSILSTTSLCREMTRRNMIGAPRLSKRVFGYWVRGRFAAGAASVGGGGAKPSSPLTSSICTIFTRTKQNMYGPWSKMAALNQGI